MHKFVICDTETTGLDQDCGVCDLALVFIDEDFNVLKTYSSLIDPEVPICPAASGVHGITNEMVEFEPTLHEFMEMHGFPLAREPEVFIAHNAQFDYKRVSPYLVTGPDMFCTLRLVRHLWPDGPPNHKLATLRYWLELNLPEGQQHRAEFDCLCVVELLKAARSQTGMGLYEMMELSKRPIAVAKMPFGKHAGMPLDQVPKSYIQWALKNIDNLDPDLRLSLEHQL